MKHLFVPYELALKLKEKEFNEECMAGYECALTSKKDPQDGYSGAHGWKKGECNFSTDYFKNRSEADTSNKNWLIVSAPRYQQVIDWFETEHKIHICYYLTASLYWEYRIVIDFTKTHKGYGNFNYFDKIINTPIDSTFKTKYEALNKAIEEALKVIQ